MTIKLPKQGTMNQFIKAMADALLKDFSVKGEALEVLGWIVREIEEREHNQKS